MKRRTTLLIISFLSALILGIWLGAWYVGAKVDLINDFSSQPIADIFSSVNALFAGFAFCGVVLTVYLQIQELQETRDVLAETAKANKETASHAKEGAILDLFQTYCSDYFQHVKNASMNVLIPAMASRMYFDFVVSRFFVAGQLNLDESCWEHISKVSRHRNYIEFKNAEQNDRYKLDELINFFTILAYQKDSNEVIARCDFSYSWWRPMFWMIALAQEFHYENNEIVKKYATPLYFKEVVTRLDAAYALEPITDIDTLIALLRDHPKLVDQYKLDPMHLDSSKWTL